MSVFVFLKQQKIVTLFIDVIFHSDGKLALELWLLSTAWLRASVMIEVWWLAAALAVTVVIVVAAVMTTKMVAAVMMMIIIMIRIHYKGHEVV